MDEWKKKLTPEQYDVLREKGTEYPFTGKFLKHNANGTYICAACNTPLFNSGSKYDSTNPFLAGWPSFADVVEKGNIELREDTSFGMTRTEILCKTCGGHLGHLFDDRESPSGKHYCINSCVLDFVPKE